MDAAAATPELKTTTDLPEGVPQKSCGGTDAQRGVDAMIANTAARAGATDAAPTVPLSQSSSPNAEGAAAAALGSAPEPHSTGRERTAVGYVRDATAAEALEAFLQRQRQQRIAPTGVDSTAGSSILTPADGTEAAGRQTESQPEPALLTSDARSDSGSSGSSEEDMRAVVIDNGARTIKVGFEDDVAPAATFPAVVGRGRHVFHLVGMPYKDHYVGHEAISKSGILMLSHPVDSLGLVANWQDMENIWRHAFYNEARVPPEESPVLMTEAVLNPKAKRERMVQICFETFLVPAFYVCTRAALALYASGRATGIVLQAGYGEPHAVPLYKGYAIAHSILAIRCMKCGQLDELMGRLLSERGYALCGSSATSGQCAQIKQQLGYVALDLEAEMRKPERSTTALQKSRQLLEFSKVTHARLGANVSADIEIATDLSHAVADLVRCDISALFQPSPEEEPIRVGSERFRCAEALFDPTLICGSGGRSTHIVVVAHIIYLTVNHPTHATLFLKLRKNCPRVDYADRLVQQDHMRGTAFHGGVHELVCRLRQLMISASKF
jgi:hypothetical protein